jgi:signal peptide peptidase-like 2B
VQNWVNGTERTTYVGLSARFGLVLPKEASVTQKHFAILADPSNCCSNSSSEVPFCLFFFFFPLKNVIQL